MTSPSTVRRPRGTSSGVSFALVGFGAALFGVYWDDAWHTDRGRDEFLSAPHLVLYAGVMLAVAVVGWWAWQGRRSGWRPLLSGPIGMAIVGAAVVLGSAPVDEWWHRVFGRDAVLWSPPHLVALFGTIALGTGVVLVAGRTLEFQFGWASSARLVAAGAGVVGGWQVLVLEYDTDVAQFSSVWYLPVLTVALAAAAVTAQSAIGHRLRWPAASAGAGYTVAMVTVIIVLRVADFSTPIVPVVVPALLVADLTRARRWSVEARSVAFAAALFAAYVPYLHFVPGAVAPTVEQAALGAAMAALAVAATIVIFDPSARLGGRRGLTGVSVAATVVIAGLFGGPRPAAAHDPGQGDAVATIELTAEVSGGRVEITASAIGSDSNLQPVRIVARRGDRTVYGDLAADPRWNGHIDLDDDGRWFVYVEARRGAEDLEAWIPVIVGSDGIESKRTELYATPDVGASRRLQVVVGAGLIGVCLAIAARVAAATRVAAQEVAM